MLKHKIVIGISGASGAIYAQSLLNVLSELSNQIEVVSMVMSNNAKTVWETELKNKNYGSYPFKIFEQTDFNAPFASGSAQYDTMIIIPCSMGVLSRIANGISNDLLTRSADVILKERKKLILVIRESPYNLIHIKNLETITLAGGIICPASPSFYSNPTTIQDLVLTIVHRVLQLANIPITNSFKWGENNKAESF